MESLRRLCDGSFFLYNVLALKDGHPEEEHEKGNEN